MIRALVLLLALAACAPPIQRPQPRPACTMLISAAVADEAGERITGMECLQ